MYRSGIEYDEMALLAIEVITDYNLCVYPLDALEVCKKLKINAIPYSSYNEETRKKLINLSRDGFCIPRVRDGRPIIYYNDDLSMIISRSRIESTIFHEIKHILCNDKNEDGKDDLADYFSKYIRCPIPLLIYLGVTEINDIITAFEISYEQACYIISNVENRKRVYGSQIFDYEKPLLETILKDKFDNNREK